MPVNPPLAQVVATRTGGRLCRPEAQVLFLALRRGLRGRRPVHERQGCRQVEPVITAHADRSNFLRRDNWIGCEAIASRLI